MEYAIQAVNLSKVYKLYNKPIDRVKETFSKKVYSREFYALNQINFEIPKGATIGFVGRNGAGKSTLLKILTGVLRPSSGEVQVNGKVSALLELGAGFNMEFTGRENIYLNATIMRIPKAEMDKRIDDILKFADIGEYIDQPVKTYSSGMFVRLAFAVAINVDPDILIVDEALAVGDTRFQLKCMEKFSEFQRKGKTILFVSHDINMIKRFCQRAIWLNHGQVVMDGATDRVTDIYTDFLRSEMTLEDFRETFDVDFGDASPDEPGEYQEENESKDEVADHTEPAKVVGAIRMKAQISEEELSRINIAELRSLILKNKDGEVVEDIVHGEEIHVEIEYAVNETNVGKPVLGVAIRSVDNKYICGLNTMLDGFKVPWERGLNKIELVYREFNLVGGSYYFDVALMDHTATVNIDYRTMFKSFFVKMGYIAEGIVVLSHHWEK